MAKIHCTSCTRQLQVSDQVLGKQVRCPLCKAVFVARIPPTPESLPAAPPPPSPPVVAVEKVLTCPRCQKPIKVGAEALGKWFNCPLCQVTFRIPKERPSEPAGKSTSVSAQRSPTSEVPLLYPVEDSRELEEPVPSRDRRGQGNLARKKSRDDPEHDARGRNDQDRRGRRKAPAKRNQRTLAIILVLAIGTPILLLSAGAAIFFVAKVINPGNPGANPNLVQDGKKERTPPKDIWGKGDKEEKKLDFKEMPKEKVKEEVKEVLVPPAEFPPFPQAVDIRSTTLSKPQTYPLPGKVEGLAVGGEGRFLVLHFPALKKLGVFDVNESKITFFLDAPGPVFFAAGMTKLLVLQPRDGAFHLQRWDLLSRQAESTTSYPVDGQVFSFCMGSGSDGPLLINTQKGLDFVNIQTLQPMQIPDQKAWGDREGRPFWPSTNGRVFGMGPIDLGLLVLEQGRIHRRPGVLRTWALVPGPDGNHLYPVGHGVVTKNFEVVKDARYSNPQHSGGGVGNTFLPAHHGSYYFHIKVKGLHKESGIDVYGHGNAQPLARFTDIPLYSYEVMQTMVSYGKVSKDFRFENMIHLLPRARLLVLLTPDREALYLQPIQEEAVTPDGAKRKPVSTLASLPTPKAGRLPILFKEQNSLVTNGQPFPSNSSIELSPNGRFLVTSQGVRVTLWELPAGNELMRMEKNIAYGSTFSKDSRRLYWLHSRQYEQVELPGLAKKTLLGNISGYDPPVLSTDEKYLLIPGVEGVKVLELATSKIQSVTMERGRAFQGAGFHPEDGRVISVGYDHVFLANLHDGKLEKFPVTLPRRPFFPRVTLHENHLAIALPFQEAWIRDQKEDQIVGRLPPQDVPAGPEVPFVARPVISLDGEKLFLPGKKDLTIWHLKTGQVYESPYPVPAVQAVAISRDGQTLALLVSDSRAQVYSVKEQQ